MPVTQQVLAAAMQMRSLKYVASSTSSDRLDRLLLFSGQLGVYAMAAFALISSRHALHLDRESSTPMLSLVVSGVELMQTTLQTLFLLDAIRRRPKHAAHVRRKPGRELVTFLLVCNIGLWAFNGLDALRQELYPAQLNFYGIKLEFSTSVCNYFSFARTKLLQYINEKPILLSAIIIL